MVSLKVYVNTLLQRAEDFEREWRADSAKHPDSFPLEMPASDWEEQFDAWLGLRGHK